MTIPIRRSRPKKTTTLKDVARHAGVSPKTVSNVLNDWPHVTDETRACVQASIDELGYRPSALATSLRTGRTHAVGVVLPDITNPFFAQVVRGCDDVLYAAGYSIFLCNTNEDPAKERCFLEMLVDRGVDGVLIFGAHTTDVYASPGTLTLPMVSEDSPGTNENVTVLIIDNVRGARLATEHLISRGHTRIGHLGGPVQRSAAEGRLEGYRAALEAAGLPYDPELVRRCQPSIRSGRIGATQLLQEQHPTALFCFNDLLAVGAMLACRQLDMPIPSRLALVGFDDIALAALVVPPLTTVRVDQYGIGRQASELLLERLTGVDMPHRRIIYPVELVVRGSCGARRMTRRQVNDMLEHMAIAELIDLEPS